MSSSFRSNRKALRLSLAIFLGLVLGAVFGLVMPDWAEPVTSLISTVYLHGLTMMIYPLVFCSLIVGIKGIGSISATGRVGGQALLYFIGTTLAASLLGLFLPKALNIGAGVAVEMAEAEVQAAEFTSMADTLKNLIPANPFASFVNGNMLQVFFANATGTELPYSLLAIVLLSNTLLSIGAPGVPNSAIASFAALAAIAGLPTGIMGMYVSVNILVDAGATCCNVLGDIASAVAMKKTCRLPDRHA